MDGYGKSNGPWEKPGLAPRTTLLEACLRVLGHRFWALTAFYDALFLAVPLAVVLTLFIPFG